MATRRVACIIGKGKNCIPEISNVAYDAGGIAAGCGFVVVTGGLGGVMASAAAGAEEAGGIVIGLIPSDAYVDQAQHLTVALRTGMTVPFRNALIGTVADVGIVCPGSDGTMQEAAVMMERGIPVAKVGDHTRWPTNSLALPDFGGLTSTAGRLDLVGWLDNLVVAFQLGE